MKAYEVFESYECDRCSGQGRLHHFSNVMGGICFKCNGATHLLTKRGQADFEQWRAAVDAATIRPLSDLKPGMFAKVSNAFRKYYEVAAVEGQTVRFVKVIRYDSGIPMLGMIEQQEFEVGDTIRIHPGVELIPKAADFDSRKAVAA